MRLLRLAEEVRQSRDCFVKMKDNEMKNLAGSFGEPAGFFICCPGLRYWHGFDLLL